MIAWILKPWNAYRRQIDIHILWPSCLAAAGGDADQARIVFHLHTQLDPAWQGLTKEEVHTIIEGLN